MAVWGSFARSRISTNEDDKLYIPYGWHYNQEKRLGVWCHGAGQTAPAIGPAELAIFEALGIPWIAHDLGGPQTWGNSSAQSALNKVWNYAKTALNVKPDKMVIWGGSMGSLTALNYLRSFPGNVAACGVALPIVDPEDVRANNRGGFGANVQTAWGNPVPDSGRPISNMEDYPSNIPIKVWADSADNIGLYSFAQTFDAGVASCSMVTLGAFGHTYLTIDVNQVLDFLRPYTE